VALYHFRCTGCGDRSRRILKPSEAKGRTCESGSCGAPLEREPKPASHQVMERLDNGIMPRAVERYAEAHRLFDERADNGPKTS